MARIYLSPPHPSGRELEFVADAISSNWLAPLGPHVDAFEQEFAAVADVPHALALSSGTAALHLALVALGIGAGRRGRLLDAHLRGERERDPLHRCRTRLRRLRRGDLDAGPGPARGGARRSARASGASVRAVLAVDLYGQCCDYDALREVCDRHDVVLLQDAAESLGATYRGRPAGGQGALAAFSFNGNKIITTSGGGMLVSADPA